MDVVFEPQGGKPFSIEVGYWDTVLEIKEKIQKYQGIPIPKQTLVFNGLILQDESDVEYCVILQNSHIQLLVASDKPQAKIEQSPPSSRKIRLKINIPSNSRTQIPLEMDVNETVLRLKEKIYETEMIPVGRLVVRSNGAELQDHMSLRDCELIDNADIDVHVKPSPTTSGTGSAGGPSPPAASTGSKKLKLLVLPKCGSKKIPVEVNASDNVSELRKELQKLHQRFHFHLPQDGFFFIYKQNVMDDDRSFRWHHVGQGDTIEIFSGSVTGGS